MIFEKAYQDSKFLFGFDVGTFKSKRVAKGDGGGEGEGLG